MALTPPANSERPRDGRLFSSRALAAAGLVIAVVAAYWSSLQAPFLFDDTGAILNNSTIRRLGSWAIFSPPSDGSTTTGRPLVNVSFAINYAISGDHVWSYHALNVLIHSLAALLLMGVVRRTLLGPVLQRTFGSSALPVAFATALIWAVHPLQTESVVCIAQRTESLCGFFYLLTFYGFVRAVEMERGETEDKVPAKKLWLAVSVFACLLGMATKEVMVTAPLLVLLYDRTFLAGNFSSALRHRFGFYAGLAGTWILLGTLMLRSGGARGVAAGFGLGVSWWTYLLKQCDALVLYLKLAVWPHPLVLDYGTSVSHSIAEVWWQGGVVVVLLIATVWALARKPVVGFLAAWFFMILAPSSSVVPLVTQTVAEHRMYLPLVALVALGVGVCHQRFGSRSTWLAAVVATTFFALTLARNRDYRDTVTIWQDSVAKRPEVARAHNNLAWALQQQGKSAEADEHFARAVALQPDYITARYSWGVALLDQKRFPEAIAQFEQAVKLAPGHTDAYVNLGNALMQVHRPAEAILNYSAALRIRPSADIYYDLGVGLNDLGRASEATQNLRAALQLQPHLPDAYYQLARAAESTGDLPSAETNYTETLRLAPDHIPAHRKLGLLLARSGRLAPATDHFRAVVRLQPDDADAQANLGNVLLLQGEVRDAVARYEEAARLRPNDARFRESLQQAKASLR